MNDHFWENKIKAFLHDPPDKALSIANHEDRRDKLLQTLNLKFDIPPEFDRIASSMERIVPRTEVWIDFSRTNISQHPILKHPITGSERRFETVSQAVLGLRRTRIGMIIEDVLKIEIETLKSLKDDNPKRTYFRIWRFFRDLITRKSEEVANLPADTRCPDHTVWDHLDASSAIYGAISKGKPALLMFKLAPVQDFIKNARKERDLWAGSHLLSYLTFQAIKVVVDEFGPDAIIFPHLRGQPFLEKEFEDFFKGIPEDVKIKDLKEKLKIANIPNKFLAIVSVKSIDEIKKKIRKTINKMLKDLLDFSLEVFDGKINVHMRNHYLNLLQNYFSVTVCVIPADLNGLMSVIKNLPNLIQKKYENWILLLEKSGYKRRDFDLYSLMFELIEEIVAIKSKKFEKLEGESKKKCTMCGELEIVGNEKMWDDVRNDLAGLFKEKEELCPICLIKRFYPIWIKNKLNIDVGFESVSKIALKKDCWLEKVEKSDLYGELIDSLKGNEKLRKLIKEKEYKLTNCELLYLENWNSKHLKENFGIAVNESELESPKEILRSLHREFGEPEKYYAILIMDGDNMGKMLMGDEMKFVKYYLHPEILKYLSQDVKNLVESSKRLITPATHSAISRALAHFSINIVPEIVNDHRGELIYAGGDDVLTLPPVDSALACAYEIQIWFNKEWDGWNVLPAKTMSAGILIVHYKHPLYDALDKVRELEGKAKDLGRDAIAVGYLARSGSYDEVIFNWEVVKLLNNNKKYNIIKLIKRSEEKDKRLPYLSKRIIYDVIREVESLPNNVGALEGFLRYEFSRHYHDVDKNRAEGFLRHMSNDVIQYAKNIRVKLEKGEFEELVSKKLQKPILRKVNELITCLIKEKKLYLEALRYGIECEGKNVEGLERVLGITDEKFYKELYGLILKKQIKELFILLKILVDCDADLRDVGCESSDGA